MSSNGLVLFFFLAIAGVLVPSSRVVPVFALMLGFSFTLARGLTGLVALRRALLSAAPITGFLAVVWIGIVGRAPDATLFYRHGDTVSALLAVTAIGTRLFLVALFTFAVAGAGAAISPSFVSGLAAPRSIKIVLLAAVSLTDVMRQGSQRAHTALVGANVLTGRSSLRNLVSGWLLLRTTWVAAIGIAAERLDTKWLHEDLPAAAPLSPHQRLTWRDMGWMGASLITIVATAARLAE